MHCWSLPILLVILLHLSNISDSVEFSNQINVSAGEAALLTCPVPAYISRNNLRGIGWFKEAAGQQQLYICQWVWQQTTINTAVEDRIDLYNYTTLRIKQTDPWDSGSYRCDISYGDIDATSEYLRLTVMVISTTTAAETTYSAATSQYITTTLGNIDESATTKTSSVPVGIIVGVICGLLFLVAIVLVALFIWRKLKWKQYGTRQDYKNTNDVQANNGKPQKNVTFKDSDETALQRLLPHNDNTDGLGDLTGSVMFVLPRWGGGMGGIYTTAHSLIYQLKREGRPVICMMGATMAELKPGEQKIINELGVKLLEPNVEYEEDYKNMSSEERVENLDYMDDFYKEHLPILKQCDKIVSVSKSTNKLASYLLYSVHAVDCELILLNLEICTTLEDKVALASSIRSATALFSLGNKAYNCITQEMRILNSDMQNFHYLFFPNFQELSSIIKPPDSSKNATRCVFMPRTNDKDFVHESICAINVYNDSCTRRNEIVKILAQTENSSQELATCSDAMLNHKNFECISCNSLHKMAETAKTSEIVLANGCFTDTGFSGLEFLVNGHITLVPEGSDVADILVQASPAHAASFLLKAGDSRPRAPNWATTIQATVMKRVDMLKKVKLLVEDLQKHSLFRESQTNMTDVLRRKLHVTEKDTSAVNSLIQGLTADTIIGRGTWSRVHMHVNKAVKRVDVRRMKINVKAMAKEAEVVIQMNHSDAQENILQLYQCLWKDDTIYFLMELARETMEQYLHKKDSKHAQLAHEKKADVLRQIFAGLEHLHKHLLVHKDLKPSNIMFMDDLLVKIADSGLARLKTNATNKPMSHADTSNSLYYMAPEALIEGKRPQPYSDVWSGCLLATEWYTGRKSWKTAGHKSFDAMKRKEEMPGQLENIPLGLRKILIDGLNYNPQDRPTSGGIKDKIK